jgi:hypothetical protein
MSQPEKVSIRPQVTMLSILKYIEYEMWFALAEFVDNSIASFQKSQNELKVVDGSNYRLKVSIEINEIENKITIRDNAGGIGEVDYQRAFRAAEIPPDNTGLSEFGMGMKSAACWFSNNWRVSSTAIGEGYEKRVNFNMDKILSDKLEELDVDTMRCDPNLHYTIIELFGVSRMPRGKNITKIKNHLKSIYRDFIRRGDLILKVDNEILSYTDPAILTVPKYNEPEGEAIYWRKEIDFPIDAGLSVKGFVAIREKGSTSEAGFSLFRRGRVVEGSYDNGFRPEMIFGAPNSYKYQRVFGELHLEGFDVAFTKKGIQWDENLDIFLQLLKDDISTKEFPLLQQAEEYRVRATEKEYQAATKALDQTVNDIARNAQKAIEDVLSQPSAFEADDTTLSNVQKNIQKDFTVEFNETYWKITIELSFDPSIKDLIEIGNHLIVNPDNSKDVRQIGIRLSLTHPFMVQHVGVDNQKIEAVLRLVAALGLSEIIAKESGAKTHGEIRRNLNELISKLTAL